jgi:hypothetical protein
VSGGTRSALYPRADRPGHAVALEQSYRTIPEHDCTLARYDWCECEHWPWDPDAESDVPEFEAYE